MEDFLNLDRRLAIAHRGGSRLRPENTIAAFDHAASLGVDAIELDVHLSKDGAVVVIHDPTLERTTSGVGLVVDHTADELARIDAGYQFRGPDGFPFRGQGIGISTLATVLARYPAMPFIIELKAPAAALAERALDVVRAAGAVDRVMFGSFRLDLLEIIRRSGAPVATSAAVPEALRAVLRSKVGLAPGRGDFQLFQLPEWRQGWRVITPGFVAGARRRGLPVHVWVVNDDADMQRLLAWGVTGLISDRPDLAMRVVRG